MYYASQKYEQCAIVSHEVTFLQQRNSKKDQSIKGRAPLGLPTKCEGTHPTKYFSVNTLRKRCSWAQHSTKHQCNCATQTRSDSKQFRITLKVSFNTFFSSAGCVGRGRLWQFVRCCPASETGRQRRWARRGRTARRPRSCPRRCAPAPSGRCGSAASRWGSRNLQGSPATRNSVKSFAKFRWQLYSAANRLIGEVVQARRRPLLGPSPGWKRLLALSHLRHY